MAQKQQGQYTLLYKILDDGNKWAAVSKCSLQQTAGAGNTPLDVVVPDSVILNGKVYAVAAINEDAFTDCKSVTSVSLPEGLLSIGKGAFMWNTRLEKINLPKSLKSIGAYTFAQCHSLRSITIPEGITELPNDVFYECRNLTTVVLPQNLHSIGEKAFDFCSKLNSIAIPPRLETIDDDAFSLCFNLGNVHLPSTLKKIGGGAFAGCPNIRFEIDEDNPSYSVKDGILFSKDYKTLISYPESAGKVYAIPEGVDSIAPDAVAYNNHCDALMTIPASVKIVGDGAFYGVDDILEITVPETVEKIGDRAFDIYNLKAIHLPNPTNLKLENIGDEFVNDRTGIYVPDKYYDYYKNLLSKEYNRWGRDYSIKKETEFEPLHSRTVEDITFKLLGEITYKGSLWTQKKEGIERLAKKAKIFLEYGATAPDHSVANKQPAYMNIPSVGNVKVALSRFYYSSVDGHCTALETKIDCYKDEFKVATYIESQLPKSYKEIARSQQYPRIALFQNDATKDIVGVAPDEKRHEVFVLLLPANGDMLKKIEETFKVTSRQ